jgi:hypothetical protein
MRAMCRAADIGATHGQQQMNAREPSPRSSSTTTQRPTELKLHAIPTRQPTPTIVLTRLLSSATLSLYSHHARTIIHGRP